MRFQFGLMVLILSAVSLVAATSFADNSVDRATLATMLRLSGSSDLQDKLVQNLDVRRADFSRGSLSSLQVGFNLADADSGPTYSNQEVLHWEPDMETRSAVVWVDHLGRRKITGQVISGLKGEDLADVLDFPEVKAKLAGDDIRSVHVQTKVGRTAIGTDLTEYDIELQTVSPDSGRPTGKIQVAWKIVGLIDRTVDDEVYVTRTPALTEPVLTSETTAAGALR